MKKLFLLTLTLFLFGCDPVEQDTRLLCDCYVSGLKSGCEDLDDYNLRGKSLVFNERKMKFVFNNSPFDESYEILFDKDIISAKTENDFFKNHKVYSQLSQEVCLLSL